MEFMLPDGGWDNSWGSRNYKWSYWGSRTSDGCHPAYALLSQHEPRFREVARRNVELMASCTHQGLLYGGPDYFAHGDQPCIHHTFTHAKALATVLDRAAAPASESRLKLPRDQAYGIRSFPEIATHLIATGPWRATVTDYDWEYVEQVQSGSGRGGGGHASGGALSLLYHQKLGPLLVASMTDYQMVEISNQQAFLDSPHMTFTPRIEFSDAHTYNSLSDFAATVDVRTAPTPAPQQVDLEARGRLLTGSHQPPSTGDITYRLAYRFTDTFVEISATTSCPTPPPSPLRFILPVISRTGEAATPSGSGAVHIAKPAGTLIIRTDASQGFDAIPTQRTFNLVPGFEAVALTIPMQPNKAIVIRIELSTS